MSFPMKMMRVFIAISLPDEIHLSLSSISAQIKRSLGDDVVRWVKPTNIHLTLKFLGEISEGDVGLLRTGLELPVGCHAPFTLAIQKVGVFPNPHRPRVVWAGLNDSMELTRLQRDVEKVVRNIGYDSEERSFSPHLTLGRVSQYANAQQIAQCGKVVSSYTVGGISDFIVKSVDIYRSELSAGGSIYTILYSIPLQKES